jgi:hypothetical protein
MRSLDRIVRPGSSIAADRYICRLVRKSSQEIESNGTLQKTRYCCIFVRNHPGTPLIAKTD